MRRSWLSSILAAILVTGTAAAQIAVESRKIEVRGTSEMIVPADELTLPVEIITSGEDFAALKQRNDLLLKQLFELLTAHGLPQPAIELTSAGFDFSPEDSGRFPGKSKGQGQQALNQPAQRNDPFGDKGEAEAQNGRPPMHLSRRLLLRFTTLPQATELLAKLTAQDAVRKSRELKLSPLQPGLKDMAAHQSKARRLAVQEAKEKATLLAEASNLHLGTAVSVTDESVGGRARASFFPRDPFGDPFGSNAPAQGNGEAKSLWLFVAFQPIKADATPEELAPGQIHISVTVHVTYEALVPK